MKTSDLTKNVIVDEAITRMERDLKTEHLPVREALALTCQILFLYGHDSGLSGQVTARGERAGTYWTQTLGLGFDEARSDNLLLIDEDLNVLDGKGMPNPANRFHSWLYRARADVKCIVHSHSLYASALSMLEIPLDISHMDPCSLYGQVAFLEKWPGIPVGNNEGEIIAKALGDKKAILLAHHGILVAGASVEEACILGVMIERAAKLQMLAMASGSIKPVDEALGVEAEQWINTPRRQAATFAYYARRARREFAER